MKKKLKELAELVGGEVVGNGDILIENVSSIEDAGKGDITFLANQRYLNHLYDTHASAVIASSKIKSINIPILCTNNPYLAFSTILSLYNPLIPSVKGVSESAHISRTATIGEDASIYPGVYVGEGVKVGERVTAFPGVFIGDNVEIGDDTVIYSNVSVREGCKIGKGVIVHCNAVIGSDGFGFVKDEDKHVKIPQVGIVRVENNVEIGAGVTIDRATMGETVIGEGTKIDNLVQIAHNVEIGEDSIIVAQVGISGSTKIGKRVTLAAQVGVVGHLKIGDDVMVGGQSGVAKDLSSGAFSGTPCFPHKDWLKSQLIFSKLPEMKKELKKLKKEIEKLKKE